MRYPSVREQPDIRYYLLRRRRYAGDNIRLRCALRTLARDVRRLGLHGLVVGPATYYRPDGADNGETLSQRSIFKDELETVIETSAKLLSERDSQREAPAKKQRSGRGIVGHREAATGMSSIASMQDV